MRAVLLAVGVAVGAGSAAGQDPAPGPEAFYPDGGVLTTRPADDPTRWRADLIFGFPSAVRVERRVGSGGWWVEGGAAAAVTAPGVFAGVRRDGFRAGGPDDTFVLRPGVDVYFFPNAGDWGAWDRGFVAATIDAELAWQHRFADRFRGSFGLKLGGAALFHRRGVLPLPTAGVVLGFQY